MKPSPRMIELDEKILLFLRKCNQPLSRFALFVVYFWFGILKIFYISPANALVNDLLAKTLPFIAFDNFIIWLGIVEMILGVLFLIPRLDRITLTLLVFHMITTFGPLVLLPNLTWDAPFVPTLEGQYIIKNLVIIAVGVGITMHIKPLRHTYMSSDSGDAVS